jgi:methyl-accepting chemotaxis protein
MSGRGSARVSQDIDHASQRSIRDRGKLLTFFQPGFKALSELIVSKSTSLADAAQETSNRLTDVTSSTVMTTIGLVIAGLTIVITGGFFTIRNWHVSPIKGLAQVMVTLANGDLSAEVGGTDRRDEVGGMAKAVQVFKDNGLNAREVETQAAAHRNMSEEERRRNAEIERLRADAMAAATTGLANGLKHLASGDLAFQLTEPFATDFESLRADFNAAVCLSARIRSRSWDRRWCVNPTIAGPWDEAQGRRRGRN